MAIVVSGFAQSVSVGSWLVPHGYSLKLADLVFLSFPAFKNEEVSGL